MVRHLVLPNELAGTERVLGFVAEEISRDTYVNIMGQYRPAHKSGGYRDISRTPTPEEMRHAFDSAHRYRLNRLGGMRPATAMAVTQLPTSNA